MSGELNLIETLDNGQFINALGQSDAKYNQHVKNIEQGAKDMDSAMKSVGAMIGTYFGATALAGFAKQIVEVTGEFQQLDVAFTTMLGSKEKAADLMGQMVATAAKTPFTLQEVAGGAKQLLAYQVAQEDVNDTLIRLGNISAGLGTPLSRLILVFGQVKAKGKLMGDDLRQFTEAGVPMIHELAKQMGVADKEVAAMVSDGKIGFKEVENVLKSLTNEGGMFFNLMDAQSKTVTGQISNLKDQFTVMLNDIGSANTGVINDAISGASYLIKHYEVIGETIIALVGVYGTYKAALMFVATAQAIVNASSAATLYLELNREIGILTLGHKARAVAIGIEAAAQEALNAVMSINPYVLVATAIAATVAVVWLLYDGTTAQERAQKALNKTLADAKQKKEDLAGATSKLTGVINNETASKFDQIDAFRQLQEQYPEALKNMDIYAFKAMSVTEQQKFLNKAVNDMNFKSLDDQIKDSSNLLNSFGKTRFEGAATPGRKADENKAREITGLNGFWDKTELGADENDVYRALEEYVDGLKKVKKLQQEQQEAARVAAMSEKERLAYYKEQVKDLEKQKAAIENVGGKTNTLNGFLDKMGEKFSLIKKQDPFNLLGFSVDELQKKIDELNGKIGGAEKSKPNGTKSFWETQKKDAEDILSGMSDTQKGSKDWNKQVAIIKDAENHLKAWDLKTKEPKKIAPFGTLEYYDQLIKKLKESVTSFDNVTGRYKNNKGVDITKDLEAAEAKKRELTFRSADEEINYKKSQYASYYSMVEAFGKEAADKQFADLLKSGNSYYDYLKTQQTKIGSDITGGKATKSEIETYNKITEELNKIDNVKGAWDSFTETMSNLKSETKTTTEYLKSLETLKNSLKDTTEGGKLSPEDKKKAVATIDQTTTKTTSDELNSLLDKYKNYSQQLTDIEVRKNADITILEKGRTAANAEQVNEAIRLRELQAGKEASAVGDAILKETALYKSLFGDLSNLSTKALLDLQKKGEDFLGGAKENVASDGTKTYTVDIIDVKGQKTQQTLSEQEYQAYVEKIKEIGKQVADKNPFAKLFDDIGKMAKGAKIDPKAIMGDIGGALNGVNAVIDSARKGLDTMGVKMDEQDKKVLDDVQGMVGGAASLAMGIASGNPIQIIQGSIDLISNGIDLIWGANDRKAMKAIAENEKQVKHLQAAFDQLKRAVDDAYGEDFYRAQGKVIGNLKEQLRLENEELALQESRDGKKYDQSAVDAATKQAQETANAIDDIYKEMSDRIMTTTGKDFASTLGSSIFDAIAQGSNAFEVIDAKSKEVVQNIVKQWLKTKFLEAPLKSMLDTLQSKITTKTGDTWTEKDLNTPEAKKAFEDFQKGVQGIGQSYAGILSQMGYLFDGNTASKTATGAIKGVTEQTAGYIEGNLTGIRLSQDRQETILGATLKIEQSQLVVLQSINQNGITTNEVLQLVYEVLKSDNGFRAQGII
jgi:tape measure domain-containing protein